MEQIKRRKILLIALVLGILVLIIQCVFLGRATNALYDKEERKMEKEERKIEKALGIQRDKEITFSEETFGLMLGYITVIVIIGAAVCNFFAWKNDSKKLKVITGILYVLPLNTIISAILCFISLKEKKHLET
jgi:uncharacterized membrane protein